MEAGAADLARDHQPRLLEHPQVLHCAEAAHLELRGEVAERAAVALEQTVEKEPAAGIRQGLEHDVVVHHQHGYVTK